MKLGLDRALAVKNYDDAMNKFLAGIEGLTPKVDAELKKLGVVATTLVTPQQMASLERQADQLKTTLLTKTGLTSQDVDKLKSQLSDVQTSIENGIQGWVDTIKTDQGAFEQAWSSFSQGISDAFQSQVVDRFKNMLAAANDALTVGLDAADAQAALDKYNAAIAKGMDDGVKQVDDAVQAVLAADKEYNAAIVSQNQTAIDQAVKDKIAATERLKNLDASGFSDQAQAVLTAGQTLVQATETVGQDQIAAAEKVYEDQKQAALAAVMDQVDAIGQQLEAGKITWGQATSAIAKVLTDNGMDASQAAALLSDNTSTAMGRMAAAVEDAVSALTAAINTLVALLQGAASSAGSTTAQIIGYAQGAASAAAEIAGYKAATGGTLDPGIAAGLAAAANAAPQTESTGSSSGGGSSSSAPPPPPIPFGNSPGYGTIPLPGKPIAMAAGGAFRVSRPTLFLAGEAGPEDVAFSGAGRGFAGSQPVIVNVHMHGPALDVLNPHIDARVEANAPAVSRVIGSRASTLNRGRML